MGVPVGLAAGLLVFAGSYWGLHMAIYGPHGAVAAVAGERLTHTPNVEHPHGMAGASSADGSAASAFAVAMDKMHGPMMEDVANPDPDMAFVLGMIPHHQGDRHG